MNEEQPTAVSGGEAARLVAAVFLVAAGLNLLWLGSAPLADTTEARHAEVGREFAEGGHWLVPTLNYQPHLTKPPLTDWLVALGIKLFGKNEFGARLGNALAAALGVALLAGFAFRLAGKRAALAAALFYFISPIYLVLGRTISIDILLATLVVGAYWAAWEASREDCPRPRLAALAFALALGLGALAKGHIVLLVVLLPVIVWTLWGRRRRLARRLSWPPAVILFLAAALPWYVYICARFPNWLPWMLGREFGKRVIGAELGDVNAGLSVLYLFGAALFCVPLAFIPFGRRAGENPPGREARRLLALWVLLPLAVFSLASAQRANYVTPLVPPLALLGGLGWVHLSSRWKDAGRAGRAATYFVPAVLGLVGAGSIAAYIILPGTDASAFALLAAAGVALTLSCTWVVLALKSSRIRDAEISFAIAGLALWGLSATAANEIKAKRTSRETCSWMRGSLPVREELVLCDNILSSVNFYLGKPVRLHGTAIPAVEVAPLQRKGQTGKEKVSFRALRNMTRRRQGVWLVLKAAGKTKVRRLRDHRCMVATCRELDPGIALVHLRQFPPEPKPRRRTVLPAPPAERIDALIADLHSPTAQKRRDAAWALGKFGPHAQTSVPMLIGLLDDPNWRVRRQAAGALGRIRYREVFVMDALTKLLDDPEPEVRRSAAGAIGLLRLSVGSANAGLIAALRDRDAGIRKAAARALGHISGTRMGTDARKAIGPLCNALRDEDEEVRGSAAYALFRLGATWRDCGPLLIESLSDEVWSVRKWAARALGGAGSARPEAVSALTSALRDDDWAVREAAAAALKAIGPEAKAAAPALLKAVNDSFWGARRAALRALASIAPESPETAAALNKALRDKTRPVRETAREMLEVITKKAPAVR